MFLALSSIHLDTIFRTHFTGSTIRFTKTDMNLVKNALKNAYEKDRACYLEHIRELSPP